MNLFNLSAKLTLNTDDYNKSMSNTVSDAEKKGNAIASKLKNVATTTAKVFTGMTTVAAGAIGTLAKLSIDQYAQYEQLVGGVETLFKNSSNKVLDYANNAYKTAGFSANEYMETITGFAASLLQGLGGDTEKAAEIGNMAVADMSDNANKMGTAIENIQNAYQGFAKQNYTMLDNLKLGYGGTKTEMERLLADAEKISGVKYDISNFNDVIEAIHVIQEQMGITGTTSLEAATTIEGSLNMTKSAWKNLMTGMADSNADFDTLVNNMVESASAFGDNILPRIEIAIQGIGKLIEKLLPPIVERIPELITTVLPSLISAGTQMIESLISGLSQSLPQIIDCGMQIIQVLGEGIINVAPMLLEAGLQLIITLGQGLASGLPQMIPTIVDLIVSMCDMFIENLPMIIDVAIEIILALVQGLINALPTLIAEVPRIINSFSSAIYNALPQILEAGVQILMMIIKGLIDTIPTLVANIPQIIMAIVNVFTMMNWASIGKNLITNIGSGISSMVSNIGSIAKNVATNVVNAIKGIFTSNGGSIGRNLISFITNGISSMLSSIVSTAKSVGTSVVNAIKNVFSLSTMQDIGKNVIKGLINGIKSMAGAVVEAAKGVVQGAINGAKKLLGIHSPSRVFMEIGEYTSEGMAIGIENNENMVQKASESMVNTAIPSEIKVAETLNVNRSTETGLINALLSKINTDKELIINIDGREFMRAVAPYKEELDIYDNRYSFA